MTSGSIFLTTPTTLLPTRIETLKTKTGVINPHKPRTSLLSQIADINRMVSALLSNNLPKSQIVEEVLVAKDSEEEGLRVTVIVERVVNGETRRYRVAVEELGDEEESDDEDIPDENTSYFTE